MGISLGSNQYGKAEVRMVHLDRSAEQHVLKDFNVTSQLMGDFTDAHLTGANDLVIATDTQKNTVYALAKTGGVSSPVDLPVHSRTSSAELRSWKSRISTVQPSPAPSMRVLRIRVLVLTSRSPIRNRPAQADQARSQMEYRQAGMRLQQLYTQTRIQVINGQFALTNDRASVIAAQASRDYQAQALDAEQKRYRLGASTTANVLQQERNLATADNTLITATAVYARDRAALLQILASTLDRYNVSLTQAAAGTMTTAPVVPGLTAPQAPAPPKPLTSTPAPLPQ